MVRMTVQVVAVVAVLSLLQVEARTACAQGCTAARGCPTITPLIPSSSFGAENPGFTNFAAPPTDQFASFSPAPAADTSAPSVALAANQALIRVNVPHAAARVWFQGATTRQQGPSRMFLSPELRAGRTYRYTVRCAWEEEGREVVREQRITVQPGRESVADFVGR